MTLSRLSPNISYSSLLVSGVMLLTSCTSPTKPKPVSTHYISIEKIPLKVALNITDEFRKVNWGDAFPGNMDASSILANEAAECARHTFVEVVELRNGGAPNIAVDAILTPSAPNIGRKPGQTMFSKDQVTIAIDWTLIDSSQKIIWEGSTSGQGMNASGWAAVLSQALEATFQKSQVILLSTPAIRRFAAVKNPASKTPFTESGPMRPELQKLCTLLQSDNRDVVIDTLKKLRQMDAKEAVPNILPCLFDGHPNVMRDGCRTLAVLGNRDVIVYVEPLLKSKDGSVRDDARKAIEALRAK